MDCSMLFRDSDTLIAYTDGSHKRDKRYEKSGGWSCVFLNDGQIEIAYSFGNVAGARSTELEAILMAITLSPKTKKLIVRTDSEDLINSIKQRIHQPGVIDEPKKGIPRKDIHKMRCIVEIAYQRNVSFEWVRGHNVDKYNIIADALANKARTKSQSRAPTFIKAGTVERIGHPALTQ